MAQVTSSLNYCTFSFICNSFIETSVCTCLYILFIVHAFTSNDISYSLLTQRFYSRNKVNSWLCNHSQQVLLKFLFTSFVLVLFQFPIPTGPHYIYAYYILSRRRMVQGSILWGVGPHQRGGQKHYIKKIYNYTPLRLYSIHKLH